jgi:hypothetical protein
LKECLRSHSHTVDVSAKSGGHRAWKQHFAGACAATKASGNISGVTDHGYGLFAWRPEKSQRDFAHMEADANAGDNCELVPPSSRYRRKTLPHRVAGGKRGAGTWPSGISDPKSSHHSVTGHMKYLAAKGHCNSREHSEKLIEYEYDLRGWQLFGKTSVASHIGE